jgi:asparagine synthase (glutamine-hydrolysing)
MRDAMRHGGPDDVGIYIDRQWPLALGHRRLSIIDLSEAGRQPMHDPVRNNWICYNGEIYNYPELKTELESLGYQFQTQSDTEVILKAYAEWGDQAFLRLNGMYAFALYDTDAAQLLLVRDHAGIKPLYYSLERGRLLFASEVRAFCAFQPDWPENPHWKALFLTFGHLPEPHTTLQGVQSLPKNHLLRFHLHQGRGAIEPYAQMPVNNTVRRLDDALDMVREELAAAVRRQLLSDAPIGLFLSGGIDSSILTLLAKPVLGDQLRTSSIVFEEAGFSEKPYQDLIIQATGARHSAHTIRQQDFDDSLDDILQAMDQPSNDGINTYFVARCAREAGLKVALSGLGADELLGGYPSFQYARYVSALRQVPRWIKNTLALLPDERWKKLQFLDIPGPAGEYLFYRGLFNPTDVARILGAQVAEIRQVLQNTLETHTHIPEHPQNRVSWLESNYYMQNQLLRDTDSMSMWHALEVRTPYLDRVLMEKIWSIDPEIKFNPKLKKHLLIKAFEHQLPRAIWDRPKRGFTFPFVHWFRQSGRLRDLHPALEPFRKQFLNGQLSWARFWVLYLSNNHASSSTAAPPVHLSQGIRHHWRH